MAGHRLLILGAAVLIPLLGTLTIAPAAAAAKSEKVLYSFCSIQGCADGFEANGSLILDPAGHLYGTTRAGGTGVNKQVCPQGCGTVFELAPAVNGEWTETVLYSFCSVASCADGALPNAGLILDAAGNLYGTATPGGASGHGIVFQLTHAGNGQWTENVVYSFCSLKGCVDGSLPNAGLIIDAAGNLYGTTSEGGGRNEGTVFELTAGLNGAWTETIIHSFGYEAADSPVGGVIFDAAGNLYGEGNGGAYGLGIVFRLTPKSIGTWSEATIYDFTGGDDGSGPGNGLSFDTHGNLYGVTNSGGMDNLGIAFELKPSERFWTMSVIHSFTGEKNDGGHPSSGLIFNKSGNLYGASIQGGFNEQGAVFKLMRSDDNRAWRESVAYSFNNNGGGGYYPTGDLSFDAAGNLYGTTNFGGANTGCGNSIGCGVVFEITP
ncbi:MAG TPA: choice-of-anchor tandem repeat GloVer-containing protein [Terriglobales bacterium]